MGIFRKFFGLVWLLAGVAIIVYLPFQAFPKIAAGKMEDVVFWSIMVVIFLPIASGLSLFGWYAWKNEYNGIQ